MPLISHDPYAYERRLKARMRARAILRYEQRLKRKSTLKWLSFKIRVQWLLPLWKKSKKVAMNSVDALTCPAILTLLALLLLAFLAGIIYVLYKIITIITSVA